MLHKAVDVLEIGISNKGYGMLECRMAYSFPRGARDQPFLLPPDLRDWLPDDHLAWFILDLISKHDNAFFPWDGRDKPREASRASVGSGPACEPFTGGIPHRRERICSVS
jgi:hypothetical protein